MALTGVLRAYVLPMRQWQCIASSRQVLLSTAAPELPDMTDAQARLVNERFQTMRQAHEALNTEFPHHRCVCARAVQ